MSPAILLLFALTGAEPTSSPVAQEYPAGQLVVCIASKCEYDDGQPADVEGPSGLRRAGTQIWFSHHLLHEAVHG